ncbi:MAG: tetratricopeptide repeat protein [Deltaproteobacteria bacterium]|nr:tetratricopeptide repeat protein [Deltaproteobacteria bacterium]
MSPAVVLPAVLAGVLATYWPALSAGALYMDDKFYIGNPLIRHPSWAAVRRIFGEVLAPSMVNGYYQPLSLLSVMLDFLDPAAQGGLLPFHRTTLLLHMLNVALVVVLLRVLFGNWLVGGLLGLLYGVHPLNADAVLWIAERKTVLSGGFAFGSMLLYVGYVRHAERVGRADWKRYGASLLLYVCALLSKPTALPLVALLLVLDYWPLQRLSRRTLLEKVPFVVVAGLSAVVTIVSQARAGQGGGTQVMNPLYLPLVMGYCLGLYLRKTVWPTSLASDYAGPQPFGPTNIEVLATVGGVLLVLAAILLSVRRTRAWLAGGLFFFVAILPTLGIIRFTSSIASNRSMYLPMVGLLLPLAWGLGRLWNRELGALKASSVRLILLGVGATLALGSARATRHYESHWSDSVTLVRYYLTLTPNDWKLHTRLGNEWIRRRDYEAAIVAFREAARLKPGWAENHLNLGRALFTVGNLAEAKQAFALALRQAPSDWRAHMLLGIALSRQNDLEGALREFRTASQIVPGNPVARHNVASTLARQEKWEEAAQEYRHTLRLDPNNGDARRALEEIGSR